MRAMKNGKGKGRKGKNGGDALAPVPEVASGVHFSHEAGGPVVTEAIPVEELNMLGVQLADLEGKFDDLEAEAKEHGAEFRKRLRIARGKIRTLSREMRSGVREVPAQQSLPGTAPAGPKLATVSPIGAQSPADLARVAAVEDEFGGGDIDLDADIGKLEADVARFTEDVEGGNEPAPVEADRDRGEAPPDF